MVGLRGCGRVLASTADIYIPILQYIRQPEFRLGACSSASHREDSFRQGPRKLYVIRCKRLFSALDGRRSLENSIVPLSLISTSEYMSPAQNVRSWPSAAEKDIGM